MTNKDFAVAVTKFFYYANNYNCVPVTYNAPGRGEVTEYLPSFFLAFDKFDIDHFNGKFEYFYKKFNGRSGAAIIEFFAELDGTNRAKLCKWINENFKQNEDFGISLKEIA